jgi:predicted acylesterase/phospholipase RssA/CRP-like cAMP-binding protein
VSSIQSAGLRKRILATLDAYFRSDLDFDDALFDELELKELAGGDWLMHQGDPGDALYFVVRGRLQAWARDGGTERGRFLNEIVPGDSVGELSLLTGAPRAVGIQAIRDSLLIRLDRESFERLARSHPDLVLRLASNVATLLQSAHSASKSLSRNLKAITILPLDSTPALDRLCSDLKDDLERQGRTLALSADRLGDQGAPVDSLGAGEKVPESLRNWLQDQEDEYRFVIYQCAAVNNSWSRFALRHSDMVLLVCDAASDPEPRDWEVDLLTSSGATIARQLLVMLQPPAGEQIRDTERWLAGRNIDFHIHLRRGEADDLSRVTRIVSGNALGLVLAGGAERGFAHLGVYRAMVELGLPVDWIGGTSIGAIMGAGIASPMTGEEMVELARDSFVDGRPFSDFTIPMMSLIRGKRMERMLEEHLDYRIEDLPRPFFCISCSLDTGSTNLHESGDLPEALRASAALPGIIPPAVVNRRLTIDGAVVNNLPVDVMQSKPVSRIVAVDLSTQAPVEVDYSSIPSPWAVLRGRYLPFARRHRVPSLSTIMLKSTMLGTQERVQAQGESADILLNPPVRKFGMTEVKSFEKIVQAGYEHARDRLGDWLEKADKDGDRSRQG